MEFVFLGTGTSGCVPEIGCLLQDTPSCKVCINALKTVPNTTAVSETLKPTLYTKDRRRNTSGLLRVPHPDGRTRNIVIDCGKTFYESAMTWFVQYGYQRIDAVILTHGHADAMMGLDDLRQWTLRGTIQSKIDVFLDHETFKVVQRSFPYLTDTKNATGGGEVALTNFHLIEAENPFQIDGFEIIPFGVEHGKYSTGEVYYSLGFKFGKLSYISDANAIPENSKNIIRGSKIIILDALRPYVHQSHFSHQECWDCIQSLCDDGGVGYFTGMTHTMSHAEIESWLSSLKSERGISVKCAFDGLELQIPE